MVHVDLGPVFLYPGLLDVEGVALLEDVQLGLREDVLLLLLVVNFGLRQLAHELEALLLQV